MLCVRDLRKGFQVLFIIDLVTDLLLCVFSWGLEEDRLLEEVLPPDKVDMDPFPSVPATG